MPKKFLSLFLAALLTNLCAAARVQAAAKDAGRDTVAAAAREEGAAGQEPADPRSAEKVKEKIVKFGPRPKEFVIVKLRDKSKKVGHITEIGDDHFAFREDKTGTLTNISYADVKQVQFTYFTPKNIKVLGIAAGSLIAVIVIAAAVGIAHGQ